MTSTGGEAPIEPRLEPQSCEDGTYAVDIDDDGMLVCSELSGDVAAAVEERCSLYAGWRDSCSGCGSGPSKSGRVSGTECENFAGADNTCIDAMLGAEALPLYGLNTDGDVNGDDTFYLGLHCEREGESPVVGPCAEGEHAVRVTVDGLVECMPTARIAAEYVRENCSLYWGWRDSCNGCSQPPSKWGVQRGVECTIGAGADNYCGVPFVNGDWTPHLGINTDGDVDDNDTFFLGLSCAPPAGDALVLAQGRCPFGTLLAGVAEDGSFECVSGAHAVADTVRNGCSLFLGYRDSCSGCTNPPAKWGSTSSLGCDAAVNTTCGQHTLDGVDVNLVGVRTDGDVDGNDKFYWGLSCGG